MTFERVGQGAPTMVGKKGLSKVLHNREKRIRQNFFAVVGSKPYPLFVKWTSPLNTTEIGENTKRKGREGDIIQFDGRYEGGANGSKRNLCLHDCSCSMR
jgi:hypothetical protein